MIHRDIITSLKNAVDHGDSLDSAVEILINSGYNPQEVREAAKFVSRGVISTQQIKPAEELVMPNQKKIIPSKFKLGGNKSKETNNVTLLQKKDMPKEMNINQPFAIKNFSSPQLTQNKSLKEQVNKIRPPKTSHKKEILLLVILLILIGILVLTVVFRESILKLFS